MSIDRRIVSILYFNGIKDVNKVEKFIGENNGYYEIIVNGDLKKLKIPGFNYETSSEEFLKAGMVDINSAIKKVPGINIVSIVKNEEKNTNIENLEYFEIPTVKDLESKIEQVNKNIEKLEYSTDSTKDQFEEIQKTSFEEEIEKTEKENEEVLKSLKETKSKPKKSRSPKLSDKKIEIVDTKNIDDDLTDFINTI